MWVSWIGNLLLFIVAFLEWALIVYGLEPEVAAGGGGGGKFLAVVLFTLPLGVVLALVYALAIINGGLDWIERGWVLRHLLGFLLATGLSWTIGLCAALYTEPMEQLPWILRPMAGWGLFVLPILSIVIGVIGLNVGVRTALSPQLMRLPQIAGAALVVIVCVGLIAEFIISSIANDIARAKAMAADDQTRNQMVLAEVEASDPAWDVGRLLGWTSRYETPAIRDLALAKLRSNSRLTEELAVRLRNNWRGEAIAFLAWNDPPDPASLAAPAREAIERLADDVRHEMRHAHYLRNDDFDPLAERVLAVADRFKDSGVDFVPAIRAFRAAFDEPRTQKITPTCQHQLDTWLARNAAR